MKCPIYDMECPMIGGSEWSQTDYHTFEQVADFGPIAGRAAPARAPMPAIAAVPAGVTLERKRPARAATLQSDVAVPCIQSVITGLLAIVGGGGVAAAAGWDVLIVSAVVGAIVTGTAWYLLLRQHSDLLWEVETITGLDLNKDGHKGKPPKKETTPLEIHIPPGQDGQGPQTLFVDLPTTIEKLRAFARAVLGGRSMSESGWTGGGRLFGKTEFVGVRDELIERGLIRWNNPEAHAQGCSLTAVGRWAFRNLAKKDEE